MKRILDWTESRKLFRSVAEASDLLAWICEPDGYCIYLSSAWHQYTGSADGQGIDWLNVIHPEDRLKTRKAFFDANDNQMEYVVSYRLERAMGGYGLAEARGVPHFDASGAYAGILGVTKTAEEAEAQTRFVNTSNGAAPRRLLTPRERQVLALFADGFTVETTATHLGLSEGTVAVHAKSAAAKLGAMNRTHAVILALRYRELNMPEHSGSAWGEDAEHPTPSAMP